MKKEIRKKMVAGNWKMNKTFEEAEKLITEIADALDEVDLKGAEVVLCPPSIYLEMATDVAYESNFKVGAQNIYPLDEGAFTGEISPLMLKALKVDYCIIGHSERRKYFHEQNDFLSQKVDALLKHDIHPIFCCGEILPEREANQHFEVVKKQLEESVFHLDEKGFKKIVIAYEPVWAIGTGVNATSGQAQEMHAYIRELIAKQYGAEVAKLTTILYGGSCNGKNASELFSNPDVDGGLIGGASLKAKDFLLIISAL
ncbi:MAG: triose-phosphate isomerase [Bacteroidales bacterium]|nr:triose-phosphate isomerase [Bacteroidales bacterium]MDD4603024.1 triose-phosphate isomerase [Bacteroidales bacterium]